MSKAVILIVFPLLLTYAALGDIRNLRIPNWLNGLIFAAFFPVALVMGMPLEMIPWHLLSFAVALALGIALFSFGFIGGGDGKMLAAVAVWFGWSDPLMTFLIFTALCGGLQALAHLAWKTLSLEYGVWGKEGALKKKVLSQKMELPYGLAIAAGGLLTMPSSVSWWSALIGG
jgi:prepilin peptidase CpaA